MEIYLRPKRSAYKHLKAHGYTVPTDVSHAKELRNHNRVPFHSAVADLLTQGNVVAIPVDPDGREYGAWQVKADPSLAGGLEAGYCEYHCQIYRPSERVPN